MTAAEVPEIMADEDGDAVSRLAVLADVVQRLRELEKYKASHEAQIKAYWKEQWKTNDSLESQTHSLRKEVREIDRWQQRIIGSIRTAGFVGGLMGAVFGIVVTIAIANVAGLAG